jgi:hypothetical protein
MRTITPSEALTWLKGFNERVDRLHNNEYSNSRFETYDSKRLKSELKKVVLYRSIAVHSKNKERVDVIINQLETRFPIAQDLREKYFPLGQPI